MIVVVVKLVVSENLANQTMQAKQTKHSRFKNILKTYRTIRDIPETYKNIKNEHRFAHNRFMSLKQEFEMTAGRFNASFERIERISSIKKKLTRTANQRTNKQLNGQLNKHLRLVTLDHPDTILLSVGLTNENIHGRLPEIFVTMERRLKLITECSERITELAENLKKQNSSRNYQKK